MDNEFNKPIRETNDYSEYQQFEALEYYKTKEVADGPSEVIRVPEQLDSTTTNPNDRLRQFQENNSYDRMEKGPEEARAQNQSQEKYQINQGGAEEVNTTTAAEAEAGAGGSSAASTTTAAAGSATGGAVVASSASLAGVTILAAAAVAAVGGSTAIALPDPLVDLSTATYEVGTDYFVYDLDIKGLTSGIDYYIDVREIDGTVVESYPVSQNGHIRHIVSGLSPNTPYDVRLYTRDSTFHDLVYYQARCSTTYDKKPKAIFNMIPDIDYEMGIYSLNCEVYISDYTNILAESYIEMFINDEEISPNIEFNNNYYTFNIRNLMNETKVSGIAYGVVYPDENQAQAQGNPLTIVIGSYDYEIQFPKDFVFNEDRSFAQYDFDVSNFSYEFDPAQGNVLSVYTGFNNVLDPRDWYRITILDDELNEITYVDTDEESVDIAIQPMYTNMTVRLTLLKMLEEEEFKELESEDIKYVIPNNFISDVSLSFNEYNFNFSGTISESIPSANCDVSFYMKDDSVIPFTMNLDYSDSTHFIYALTDAT